MEHLQSSPITGSYGTVYGVNPPTNGAISTAVNELIDEIEALKSQMKFQIEELKKPKWNSGYLRAKYG